MIYVATVGEEEPHGGRLVTLRKVPSLDSKKKNDWVFIWGTSVETDAELVRAWEIVGEQIVDDTVAEAKKEETR